MTNFVATISSAISGTISLSGSVTFQGTLNELFTNYSGSQVQLITSEYNGVEGNVLFFPQIVEEDSIFDISELVMIISPNDGVLNPGSSSFSVTDQALFGEDAQVFGQTTVGNQPSIVSTPAGNNAWQFSGSHSLTLVDPTSTDVSWATQGLYACWLNWSGEGDDSIITCKDGSNYRLAWGFNGSLGVNFSETTTTFLHSSASLQPNSWHYIELVLDCSLSSSERGKFYIDREFISPINIVGTWPSSLASGTSFEIGTNFGGNYLHGLMGNFYVCNGIPTDQERDIIMAYQAPITGSF